jgi:hypothetical protein
MVSSVSTLFSLSRGQQRPQVPCTLRRPELPQRLGFDLADALARDVELLANLLPESYSSDAKILNGITNTYYCSGSVVDRFSSDY